MLWGERLIEEKKKKKRKSFGGRRVEIKTLVSPSSVWGGKKKKKIGKK